MRQREREEGREAEDIIRPRQGVTGQNGDLDHRHIGKDRKGIREEEGAQAESRKKRGATSAEINSNTAWFSVVNLAAAVLSCPVLSGLVLSCHVWYHRILR